MRLTRWGLAWQHGSAPSSSYLINPLASFSFLLSCFLILLDLGFWYRRRYAPPSLTPTSVSRYSAYIDHVRSFRPESLPCRLGRSDVRRRLFKSWPEFYPSLMHAVVRVSTSRIPNVLSIDSVPSTMSSSLVLLCFDFSMARLLLTRHNLQISKLASRLRECTLIHCTHIAYTVISPVIAPLIWFGL